jgi:hypothetical protein
MSAPTLLFPTRTETPAAARPTRTWTITEHTEDGPVVHRNVSQRDAVSHLEALVRGARLPQPAAQVDDAAERLAA